MITKEQYSSLPRFINHSAARKYFKDIYGELFVMKHVETVNSTKVFYYHLVTDKETYLQNFKKIDSGFSVDQYDCFQDVEVTENGNVYLVY